MSDIDSAIKWSRKFEGLLKRRYGATGKGLHQLVSSVEGQLEADVVRKLRFIATIRNKIVHEDDYEKIDDRKAFRDACTFCLRRLQPRRLWPWILGAVILLLVIAGVVVALLR